jgi:hypothetical protein
MFTLSVSDATYLDSIGSLNPDPGRYQRKWTF